jgi:protein-disulfide isomerase
MAKQRVEPGRGRKPGVVKAAKQSSTSSRAFFILIGAIAVLGILALTYASTRPQGGAVVSRIDSTLAPVTSAGYVLGSPTAPLEVTEFGDFECPQCGRFATLTEPDVRARLVAPGLIRYRYIDFPLDMHPNTWNASRAAACADEQGKFWEMHDAIYANQDRWDGEATKNPDKVLKQVGGQLPGVNADSLNKCIDSKRTQAKIQAHWKLATDRKLGGTPTFIFGNKVISAFLTYDQFKAMTDSALAALPKSSGVPSKVGGDTGKAVVLPGGKKGE